MISTFTPCARAENNTRNPPNFILMGGAIYFKTCPSTQGRTMKFYLVGLSTLRTDFSAKIFLDSLSSTTHNFTWTFRGIFLTIKFLDRIRNQWGFSHQHTHPPMCAPVNTFSNARKTIGNISPGVSE